MCLCRPEAVNSLTASVTQRKRRKFTHFTTFTFSPCPRVFQFNIRCSLRPPGRIRISMSGSRPTVMTPVPSGGSPTYMIAGRQYVSARLVKCAWFDNKKNNYVVDNRRTKTNRRHMLRENYTFSDFDFAILYIDDFPCFSKCYLPIPPAEIEYDFSTVQIAKSHESLTYTRFLCRIG